MYCLHGVLQMGDDVSCLDIAPVMEGRARCRFLAVGCYDSTVRVMGLDPEDELRQLALQVIEYCVFGN